MNAIETKMAIAAELDRLEAMSPDDIASYLLKHNITGTVGDPRDCAIHRYLASRGIDMGELRVVASGITGRIHGELVGIHHGYNVGRMIMAFDRRKFPQLIDWETTRPRDEFQKAFVDAACASIQVNQAATAHYLNAVSNDVTHDTIAYAHA